MLPPPTAASCAAQTGACVPSRWAAALGAPALRVVGMSMEGKTRCAAPSYCQPVCPYLVPLPPAVGAGGGGRPAALAGGAGRAGRAVPRAAVSGQERLPWEPCIDVGTAVHGWHPWQSPAPPLEPYPNLYTFLRSDFNLPKILAQDLDVFCGLLADIFPGVDPLRQVGRAGPAGTVLLSSAVCLALLPAAATAGCLRRVKSPAAARPCI